MFENDVRVGFYSPNGEMLDVFVCPDTGEVYYVDEQGVPYLIIGIDHTTADLDKDNTVAANNQEVIECDGVVYDNGVKYIIRDDTAYKVPADALSTDGALDVITEMDFCCEYTPDD